MSISKLARAFLMGLACASGAGAHYWCHLNLDISFQDGATCPAPVFEVFYLPDSIYFFSPPCGKLSQDYNGHCDLTNTVTFSSKGYYRVSGPLQDHCTRTSLGAKPAPEPIAQADCKVTLEPGPIADAGQDHSVKLYARDTLSALASQALPGRPILKYLWRARLSETDKPNPGTVVFSDSTAAKPSFIPIVAGDYRFFVSVEDEKGSGAWDTVKVHVCAASENCPTLGVRAPSIPVSGAIQVRRESPQRIVFQVPAGAAFVTVLDPNGRQRASLQPKGGRAVWERSGKRDSESRQSYLVFAQLTGGKVLKSRVFLTP